MSHQNDAPSAPDRAATMTTPTNSDFRTLAFATAQVEALTARNIDPHGNDDTVLGVQFVYCTQHVAPHGTGWCTVSNHDKVPLRSTSREEAAQEVRDNGWPITGEPFPCTGCGQMVNLNGHHTLVVVDSEGKKTTDARCPTPAGPGTQHRWA